MQIKRFLNQSEVKFVYITFLTSGIGFLKSFIILGYISLSEISLISLCQTFISTISLFQLGIVTGGYRIFSFKKIELLKKINNAVFVFFVLLTILLLLFGSILYFFKFQKEFSFPIFILFLLVGVLGLYTNWLTNKLLGIQELEIINKLQITSNLITFALTVSVIWLDFSVVILAIVLQPVFFIAMAYKIKPILIPSFNIYHFKKLIFKIFNLGFIPYLTSALTALNTQIGRWMIVFFLGTIALGNVYLPALFLLVTSIIPGSLSNIYFPKIISTYENNEKTELNKILKKYFSFLFIYNILEILSVFLFLDFFIHNFFPKRYPSINLIYAVLPSLFFTQMSNPAICFFNAAKKFNVILVGGILMVVANVVCLYVYFQFNGPTLINFFVIESFSNFVFFIYNIFYLIKYNKKKYEKKT